MNFKLLLLLTSLIFSSLAISSETNSFDLNHAKWDAILKTYTKKVNSQVLVNYAEIKKNRDKLVSYLTELESLKEDEFNKFSKNDKLAFWINAYNAYTVDLIARNYPVKSIKDLGSIFSSTWSKEFIKLFNKEMSLDDIEHETIRKQFKEPRIHFAVNCASMGCPSLAQFAYIGNKLDTQLTQMTNSFLNNKEKNYYDSKEGVLYLSKIFKWYGADFNSKHKGYLNFVTKKLKLKSKPTITVEWLDYDWNLNEFK